MADLLYPSLWLSPAALLVVGALLFASSELLPRRLSHFLGGAAWLLSAGVTATAFLDVLKAGGWEDFQLTGFKGAQLYSTLFNDVIHFSLRPKGALLLVLLHIASGLLLWVGPAAIGGGERRDPKPMQPTQFGLALMGLGGLVVSLMAGSFPFVLAGTLFSSTCALGLLYFSAPERDEANAASSVWGISLVADGVVFCGASLGFVATGSDHPMGILSLFLRMSDTPIVEQGMLTGFPTAWVTTGTSLLLATGIALRSAPFLLSGFWLRATGASLPVLSFAHHVLWMGGTLLLVDVTAPLIALSPFVRDAFVLFLTVSSVWHAVAAVLQKKVEALLLHLPFSIALVAIVSGLLGLSTSMVLALGLYWLGIGVFASAMSIAIEAQQGQTDILKMGGLWRHLRRSETATTLAVTSWSVLPGAGGVLVLSKATSVLSTGNSAHLLTAILLLLWGLLFVFALHRFSFAVFSGDENRGDEPLNLQHEKMPKQGMLRVLPALLISLAMLIAPVVFALPERLVQFLLPEFRAPLAALLVPEQRAFSVVHGLLKVPLKDPAPIVPLGLLLALSIGAGFGIWLAARGYRKTLLSTTATFQQTPLWVRFEKFALNYSLSERAVDRVISSPIDRASKGLWSIAYPVLVEGTSHRIVTVPLSIAGFFLRIANNGDVQRGLMLMLVVAGALLSWWSQR